MVQQTGTLLMLSGGIHSLYILIDLLKQSDQRVYAHYVQLQAADYDSTAATQACQHIVDYCSMHYRPFSFSRSLLDHGNLSIQGGELVAIVYESALAAKTFCDRETVTIERCLLAGSLQQQEISPPNRYVRQSFAAGYYPEVPPPLQKIWVDKNIALAELPRDLLQLCTLD